MAEQLKRDYDIIVLKVEAGPGPPSNAVPRDALVQFTLQYHEGVHLVDGPRWRFLLSRIMPLELDPRMARGGGPPVELPADMLDGLRDGFAMAGGQERPLWVHLVRPYGLLRIVPWERLLGNALGVPVLMVPDFLFAPAREALKVLDVVLCGSAPLGHETASVHDALRQAADRILDSAAAARRVRLHVFTDRDIARALAARWQADGRLGGAIVVHGHERAAPYVAEDPAARAVDPARNLRSPWLLWMRDALSGQGVDVVHFACHGHYARDRGALLFAQSPLERTQRYLAGPVGVAELGSFLTQVGAWSTVFTALPDNHSDPGLRWLADEIAQSRPGPMMMHSLAVDPDAQALGAGYGFLYGPGPQVAPRSQALFIYCQPYLEAGAARVAQAAAAPAPRPRAGRPRAGAAPKARPPAPARPVPGAPIARNPVQEAAAARSMEPSPLDPYFLGERVPSLVASTERFAEQVQLLYQRLARDELLPAGGPKAAEVDATFDTLDKLRAAVADVEARARGGPDDGDPGGGDPGGGASGDGP